MAVGGEFEPVDTDDAMIGVGLADGAPVINDIIVFGARYMDDRVVACAGCDGAVLLEDLADALEGAGGFIGHGVGHRVIGAGPAAFGPHKIVFAVAGDHIGALDIAFGCDLFVCFSVGEGEEGFEVGAEAGDIAVAPAAVDHVVLSIFVVEDGLVDGLGAVVELAYEGLAEVVPVGALGMTRYGYADAAFGRIVLDIIGGEEEIIAAVLFRDGGCPHGAFGPTDGVGVKDMRVLRPLNKVRRRECVQEDLLFIFVGKGRIDPIIRIEDRCFGVGVPAGEDGVAGLGWEGTVLTGRFECHALGPGGV